MRCLSREYCRLTSLKQKSYERDYTGFAAGPNSFVTFPLDSGTTIMQTYSASCTSGMLKD
jgi:hypothetical protein